MKFYIKFHCHYLKELFFEVNSKKRALRIADRMQDYFGLPCEHVELFHCLHRRTKEGYTVAAQILSQKEKDRRKKNAES